MRDGWQRFIRAVRRVDHLRAVARDKINELQHVAPERGVEPIAHLVQQEDARVTDQRARDQDLAQLAGGKSLHVAPKQRPDPLRARGG